VEPTIRFSARARRVSLRALPDGTVEVVAPVGSNRRRIDRLIAESADWLERVEHRRATTPRLGLDRPGVVWRHGDPIRVVRDHGAPRVEADDGIVLVRAGDDDAAIRAITRWYRSLSRDFLEMTTSATAREMGLETPRTAVREARSRWGSCTPARQSLSFNWRLILVPAPVARYVVVHELAHLRHADHGARFWSLVGRHEPAVAEHRAWLRRYGAQVLTYDPAAAIR
jgi:predicted metal-dependent hydrolase